MWASWYRRKQKRLKLSRPLFLFSSLKIRNGGDVQHCLNMHGPRSCFCAFNECIKYRMPFRLLLSPLPFYAFISLIENSLREWDCACWIAIDLQFTAIASLYVWGGACSVEVPPDLKVPCQPDLLKAWNSLGSVLAWRYEDKRRRKVLVGGRKRQGSSTSRLNNRLLRRRTEHTQSDPRHQRICPNFRCLFSLIRSIEGIIMLAWVLSFLGVLSKIK